MILSEIFGSLEFAVFWAFKVSVFVCSGDYLIVSMSEPTETRSTESTSNRAITSNSRHWTPVSHAKFEVEKFDGSNNFGMWRCKVKDMLVQMTSMK